MAVDLVATTPDLGVPRLHGISVGFAVETADQLEREARALLRWEAENICKDVSRSHGKYVTQSPDADCAVAGSRAPRSAVGTAPRRPSHGCSQRALRDSGQVPERSWGTAAVARPRLAACEL